jgi:uncharacterized protein
MTHPTARLPETRGDSYGCRPRAAGPLPTIIGYAAIFDRLSSPILGNDGAWFVERVRRGAFAAVLRTRPDVAAVIEHDQHLSLGSTSAGTLRLWEDDDGLRFEIDPPAGAFGVGTVERIQSHDLRGASFRFHAGEVGWSGGAREVRTVARLHDVSLTSRPSYRQTIGAVGLMSRGASREQADRLARLLLAEASL